MSSDLYFYDTTASLYHHSSPEMVSSDGDFLIYDPFSSSSFNDSSSTDIFQEISHNNNIQNSVQNSISLASSILSCSPPSNQLENLSLYQTNSSQVGNGYANLDILGVKTEESQMGFEFDSSSSSSAYNSNNSNNNQIFIAPPHHHSYNSEEAENVAAKLMQRSYSSNSFEGKPDFLFQPRFDTLLESPNCPENSFFAGQLRRVCSTGDLQNIRSSSSSNRSFSSPLGNESSFLEEGNFKVGRYSAEERKDRISKYRAKRNQRNFTKTIKYACRKTLADNRPRIRGRFARNDETCEIPKAACSIRHEDADELWFGGLNGEEEEGGIRRGGFINNYGSYGQAQFQYYSY